MTLSRFPARCVGSDGAWPSKGTCLRSEAAPALLAAPRASVRVRPFLCLSCQSVALLMLCKFFCSPLQRLMKPSSTIWGGGSYGPTCRCSLRRKLKESPGRSGSSQYFFQNFGWGGAHQESLFCQCSKDTWSSRCHQVGYSAVLIFLRGRALLAQPWQGTVSSPTECRGGARQMLSLRKKYRRVRLKMWD